MNRPNGFSVEEIGRITINIYPKPTVYVGDDQDFQNPRCEVVEDWAIVLTERAKKRFPLCKFSVGIGIHDADHRVYAEIIITSPGGSHAEAAEWLKYQTD